MRRSVVLGMTIAGLVGGAVGGVAVAAGPSGAVTPDTPVPLDPALAPAASAAPTLLPPSSVPPLGTNPAQPPAAPSTSAWLATTSTAPPLTAPASTLPPPVHRPGGERRHHVDRCDGVRSTDWRS